MDTQVLSREAKRRIQAKAQHARGLCTTATYDEDKQDWIWCQNPQLVGGRKRKCKACLQASGKVSDILLSEGICRCKQNHPLGHDCPDRLLREGRIHLITEEQAQWYHMELLTNGGKIDVRSHDPLTTSEQRHVNNFAKNFGFFASTVPKSLKTFVKSYRSLNSIKGRLNRTQRNWLILGAHLCFNNFTNKKLDLQTLIKRQLSESIRKGMQGAALSGRRAGRPRKPSPPGLATLPPKK